MVRLTVDLILGAAQCLNPVRERELDLRGYKIPNVENLGATQNQFDTIDFSDNEIRKLDNFPYLPRLKCLLLNNNRVVRLSPTLAESLPNLNSLILTNNNLQELSDLEPLSALTSLSTLSLLHNAVVSKPNYRLFMIHKCPSLKVLDFKKVKDKERNEAKALFKSKQGKEQLKDIEKRAKTFVPGEPVSGGPVSNKAPQLVGLTPQQVKDIKASISRATTLEEIEKLNDILRTGQIPGSTSSNGANGHRKDQPEEEHDEDDEHMDVDQSTLAT